MTRVRLEGFRELEEALSKLPKATGKNVLRRVAKGALEPMANQASGMTPVETGKLAFNIAVSEKRTGRARRFRTPGSMGITMAMGPVSGQGVLEYASFVEFGTNDTAAAPYMRPAWDAQSRPALEYIKDNLWREIDKASAKYARKLAKAAG